MTPHSIRFDASGLLRLFIHSAEILTLERRSLRARRVDSFHYRFDVRAKGEIAFAPTLLALALS